MDLIHGTSSSRARGVINEVNTGTSIIRVIMTKYNNKSLHQSEIRLTWCAGCEGDDYIDSNTFWEWVRRESENKRFTIHHESGRGKHLYYVRVGNEIVCTVELCICVTNKDYLQTRMRLMRYCNQDWRCRWDPTLRKNRECLSPSIHDP